MSLHPRLKIPFAFLVLMLSASLARAASVSDVTLPNGMKVITREGHSINLVAVDIWVRAGSVNETAANNGVSHFIEHMIFKATKRFGPGQIDREIEGLGAELNAGTSKDYVHFYTTVDSDYLPKALDVIADAVMNAQFRQEDVDKERQVVLDEIARGESNPSQTALNTFAQTMFTVHPYRFPSTGSRELVKKLTRNDLVDYYKKYFVPRNTCVVVAGDIKPTEAVAAVEKAFAGYTGNKDASFPQPPDEPPMKMPCVRRFNSDTDRAYVVLGYRAPAASEFKDVCTLDVVLALLGNTDDGRIARTLTASGIQFGTIATDFVAQRYPATFAALVSVDPKDVDKLTPLLISEFHRLATEDVPDGELERAKEIVVGGDLYDQETFSGQARALGLYEMADSYVDAVNYGTVVQAVTAEDIRSVAQKYFTSAGCCETILSREKAK